MIDRTKYLKLFDKTVVLVTFATGIGKPDKPSIIKELPKDYYTDKEIEDILRKIFKSKDSEDIWHVHIGMYNKIGEFLKGRNRIIASNASPEHTNMLQYANEFKEIRKVRNKLFKFRKEFMQDYINKIVSNSNPLSSDMQLVYRDNYYSDSLVCKIIISLDKTNLDNDWFEEPEAKFEEYLINERIKYDIIKIHKFHGDTFEFKIEFDIPDLTENFYSYHRWVNSGIEI